MNDALVAAGRRETGDELPAIVAAWAALCAVMTMRLQFLNPVPVPAASWWLVAGVVAFLVPLGRFGLATLALDWNGIDGLSQAERAGPSAGWYCARSGAQ